MNETEEPNPQAAQDAFEVRMLAIRQFWLTNLGLTLGEAVLCTTGGGEGFQGILEDIMLDGDTAMPLMVIMQTAGGLGRICVRWHRISMITSYVPDNNDVSAATTAAATTADESVSIAKLVEFADSQGLDVPDDIRGLLGTPGL